MPILLIHFLWFLGSVVLNFILVSAHPKNHFVCVLVFRARMIGWGISIDCNSHWHNSLVGAWMVLHSLVTDGVGLMLAALNDCHWNVWTGQVVSGSLLLLLFLFLGLLFTLHDDELISRNALTNQIEMQAYQVNQEYCKQANQKRIRPHCHHGPQVQFPLIFSPQ